MDEKEAIKKVIDDFFANASKLDLLELEALLTSHHQNMTQSQPQIKPKRQSPLGKMDVNNIANRFASDIRTRMGLTSEQITRSARDAVRTMILQYDPYIPEEKINTLLNTWVPDKKKAAKNIPDDAMRAMIAQYIAYGRGELTDEQIAGFPKGWATKYWSFFPERIQLLIRAHIKNQITRTVFWDAIDSLIGKG